MCSGCIYREVGGHFQWVFFLSRIVKTFISRYVKPFVLCFNHLAAQNKLHHHLFLKNMGHNANAELQLDGYFQCYSQELQGCHWKLISPIYGTECLGCRWGCTLCFLHFIFHNWARVASDGENIKTHQNIKSPFPCT